VHGGGAGGGGGGAGGGGAGGCCAAVRRWPFFVDPAERTMPLLLGTLGAVASLLAWLMDEAIAGLASLHGAAERLAGGSWFGGYVLWLAFRLGAALLAVGLTRRLSPQAAGSGIPEMRSVLQGFDIGPAFTSPRTLLAKVAGLTLAIGGGLSVGKEGPFVHTSCIIAVQLMRLPCFRAVTESAELVHHVLSAACAVGVAAAFGAPIGGVLFSIEVTSQFYLTRNYWSAFFCAVSGALVFSLLHGEDDVSLFATRFANDRPDGKGGGSTLAYDHSELPFFLLLAAMCGAAGGAFVRLFGWVVAWRRRQQQRGVFGRSHYAFAAAAVLLVGAIEYPVGKYMVLSLREAIVQLFDSSDSANAQEMRATWSSPSLLLSLLFFTAVRFVGTAVNVGLPLPCGVVTPVFAVGAGLGRIFGEVMVSGFGVGQAALAGGYAVVGAAAFCAGVTGTVSVAVIVFELTGELQLAMPVLLAVLIARSSAAAVSPCIYDVISAARAIPGWPTPTRRETHVLTAGEAMVALAPESNEGCCAALPRVTTRARVEAMLRPAAAPGDGGGDAGGGDAGGGDGYADGETFAILQDCESSLLLGVGRRAELEGLLAQWPAAEGEPADVLSAVNPDYKRCSVDCSVTLAHACFLFAVHKVPRIYVTERSRCVGFLDAAALVGKV
jgi:chloride channel 2